jgi:hypothetical protein
MECENSWDRQYTSGETNPLEGILTEMPCYERTVERANSPADHIAQILACKCDLKCTWASTAPIRLFKASSRDKLIYEFMRFHCPVKYRTWCNHNCVVPQNPPQTGTKSFLIKILPNPPPRVGDKQALAHVLTAVTTGVAEYRQGSPNEAL